MTAHGRERRSARRDAAVAIAIVIAVTTLLIAARAGGDGHRPTAKEGTAFVGAVDHLPAGWHEVRRPLTDVILPVQVFAAATYPIVLHHRSAWCGPPRSVLAAMPPGGVLLQVIEYPPRAPDGQPVRLPCLPRRPDRFAWADATWARFECAGPSFKFDYRQGGHALQAQVWMHRGPVDPLLRRGALRILDQLR